MCLPLITSLVLQFKMREPELCHVLCRVTLDADTAKQFKEKIEDEYRVNMWVKYYLKKQTSCHYLLSYSIYYALSN